MVGKANTKTNEIDSIINLQKSNKRQFGLARQNFTGISSSASTPTGQSGKSGQKSNDTLSGVLRTKGDSMIGPIAFSTKTRTVVGGVLDISEATKSGYSSYIIASAGAGTTDLNTITGAAFNGQILLLESPATVTIRLKHNVSNIFIPDAADFNIIPYSIAILLYDYTTTKWNLVSSFARNGGMTNPATAILDMAGFDIENTSNIIPIDVGLSAIGTSTNYYSTVSAKELRVLGNSVNSTDTAKAAIFRTSSQGITIKSDTIGASFGRTVFTDKDGDIRADFDYAVGSKYFKFNYATGGFAIRHNASDVDALLIYPVGNPWSANNILINANAAFTAGNGILIQRDSIDKIKIDADVNLLVNTYISGNLTMNSNDIFQVRKITPTITNSAYTIGLDSTNNRWHSAYLNAIYTQGINLRDTALTVGQTGVIEFINTIGINVVSAISNARFRFQGLDPSIQIGNAYYVDTNDSTTSRSHTTGMFQESASGATPKILALLAWDEFVFRGYGETTTATSRGVVKGYSASSDITTTLLPASFFTVAKNTTSGVVKLWYNDAGTLKSVTLT